MSGAGMFRVEQDHPALPGHFPGRPIVPGVLLIDRVVAAIEETHGALGCLRLPRVKFARPLLPGETARIEFEPVGEAGARRWRFRIVHAGGDVLASGDIVAT